MHIKKSISFARLVVILIFISSFSTSVQAKSLYVAMHGNEAAEAYKIQGSNIQYQTISQGQQFEWVALALDPNSGIIFVTAEDSYNISLLNAKTMVFEENQAPVNENATLAGIVFDSKKQKLYVVGRQTQHLYSFLWNSELKVLFPESESYYYLNVPSPYAYGIDLDDMKGELYVTNATNIIHCYDTNTWEYKGSISIVVDNNQRGAVGIAIDSTRHYMYTGSFTGTIGQHTYLVRTDINDPNNPTFSEIDINDYVTGLAMDEETGYLYVGATTYDHSTMDIRVYNTLTWPSEPCYTESNYVSQPAGICLGGNVQYKPPVFHFEKVDINEPNSVLPEDYITYRITYGPNGVEQNNIVITDFLAGEVNYINPSDTNYNAEKHTYTWAIGHLSAGASNNSVTLTVQVNYGAAPNSVIVNYCEIESDDAYKTAFAYTNVGFWQPYSDIIYVDDTSPCSPGTGISWQFAYSDLQNALERAADGNEHQIWVAGGTYLPSVADPDDPYGPLTFKLINGVPLYGHFAGNEKYIYQRNLTNPADESIISRGGDYIENIITASDLNQITILDGFTITGNSTLVWIDSSILNVKNCLISGSAGQKGIYSYNSYFSVSDCIIQNLLGDSGSGIYAEDSNFTVTDCNIHNNTYGINVFSSLTGSRIINNIIYNNSNGVSADNSGSLLIANNWIHHNSGTGIYTNNGAIIRNDTIVINGTYGIYDDGTPPVITSSIIYSNYYDDLYWGDAPYSWLTSDGDPCFTAPESNDFHLDPNSPCIDTGDPCFVDYNDTDIDGEPRISNNMVDIGADEYYWPKADYDRDGIVNFVDFAKLAADWQQPDSNWSLDIDTDVDMDDLSLFCKDWLWIAPWSPLYQSLGLGDMGMMAESSSESFVLSEEMLSETVMEEPSENNDQPMSNEQIQELIDWTEQLWESNPELMEMAGHAGYDLIMSSLKEQLDQ